MRGTIEKRRPDYKVSGIRCIYMYEAHWLVYRCLYDKRFISLHLLRNAIDN